jgi:hypothetical protein
MALFGAHERDRVHRLTSSTLDLLGLVCGLPDSDVLAVARRRLLESMSGQAYACQYWYSKMAETEIDAGRTLPPAVIAIIRRSAHLHQPGTRLAARLPELALNVGEARTDRLPRGRRRAADSSARSASRTRGPRSCPGSPWSANRAPCR